MLINTFQFHLIIEQSSIGHRRTLLFIMREMIGTERDYVRSLRYIIDQYTDELNREDIPQAMRGQRNVIFGNVEKICEFHQQHFLRELEQYEHHPLKVGAAFLAHEAKFYLYALYNKNKPKSDSLMSEYGSRFFKVSFRVHHRRLCRFTIDYSIRRPNRSSWRTKWTWARTC